ncbi:hypothetical protein HanPSC8_Chr10g0418831 [Helianthus annuus]|nr:hypothetical protein HanPSC8_Chr10g0418831 [Helianthus annuus]
MGWWSIGKAFKHLGMGRSWVQVLQIVGNKRNFLLKKYTFLY